MRQRTRSAHAATSTQLQPTLRQQTKRAGVAGADTGGAHTQVAARSSSEMLKLPMAALTRAGAAGARTGGAHAQVAARSSSEMLKLPMAALTRAGVAGACRRSTASPPGSLAVSCRAPRAARSARAALTAICAAAASASRIACGEPMACMRALG